MKPHLKPRLQQIGRNKRKLEFMQSKANKIHNQFSFKKKTSNQTLSLEELQAELSNQQERLAFMQNHAHQLRMELDQVRDKQYRFKKLWVVRLLKPLIQLEKGIRSTNTYRRRFRKLAQDKGGTQQAFQIIKKVYRQSGFHAVKQYLKDFMTFPQANDEYEFNMKNGLVILTAPQTYYIAKLFSQSLDKIHIQNKILLSEPDNGYEEDKWHIVICPQIFRKLPKHYLAFQMEQSVSNRWFTYNYFNRLKHAKFIFDCAIPNLQFLQDNGIPFQKLFYLPVGLLENTERQPENTSSYKYDIAFYGDADCERRQYFLQKLQEKFSVKIISKVFGEDLYQILNQAKMVVNIHYYENALLETTRIHECLSLNKLVISEIGSDQKEHTHLNDLVDFVAVDDVDAMIKRVDYWLKHNNEFNQRIEKIKETRIQANSFQFFFYRFLLSQDLLSFEQFYDLCADYVQPEGDFWCLSLPESVSRRQDFQRDNHYNISIVNGLRHKIGWIGCGLSYKFLMKRAQDLNLPQVTICEDDVLLGNHFEHRYRYIHSTLLNTNEKWDIFSGLVSDLSKDVVIGNSPIKGNQEHFYTINRLVSTVCNIYNQSAYSKICEWDYQKRTTDNTIDRYIETHGGMKGLIASPFLVGHKEDLDSTLWGIKNTTYANMINNSQNLLNQKISELKK
ncbi:glycosyltransferase family protein [Wielerella bovis]|uniref:glycosyltransferase family protein n=1 Tax=Wielerella bovis TaxID=2917790 RepID=UPI0020185D0A|nr:glycosyltransferase family 25 protein [Wielerella bovis]ULJ65327.1 glycosyltransferase family 25 protein [Wielerella bovis]ULJ67674.1 glycosyltransferase family 25 protein [Wielerella bovis]